MNKPFLFKVIGVLTLTLLMSWAVSYVNNLILERQQRQLEARNNISQTTARAQTALGPILVIPYLEEYPETIMVDNQQQIVTRSYSGKVYLFPEDFIYSISSLVYCDNALASRSLPHDPLGQLTMLCRPLIASGLCIIGVRCLRDLNFIVLPDPLAMKSSMALRKQSREEHGIAKLTD